MALIYTDAIQYYFRPIGGTWENITEVVAFDWSRDISTYEPEYKNTTARPTYETARKTSAEYEIDVVDGAEFSDYLWTNEDARNEELEICRVATHRATLGEAEAKIARFTLMPNLADGAASEALRHTGTITMVSADWTYGTFNTGTKTFTEATS